MHKTLYALSAALLLLALLGCAGRGQPTPLPHNPPTLIIIGGGALGETRIRPAFLSAVHAKPGMPGNVLVLPTASGAPEESGLATTLALRDITTRHEVGVLMLTTENPQRADEDAAAQKIRSADGLWFTGGDQSRITRVFRPPGTPAGANPSNAAETGEGPSRAYEALHAMFARGGTIAGTSAGAAMMSDPMIAGGQSEAALLHGAGDAGVRIAPGMGLFSYGLIDQHFLQRGRLGRLIAALEATDTRLGFGIEERRAAVVHLGDDHTLTATGADGVLIVDRAHAARDTRGGRTNIRLTLLGTDDRWDLLLGQPVPAFAKQRRDTITLPIDGPALDPRRDAWAPGAVRDAIHALATNPGTPQVLYSEHFTLTFSADDATTFYVSRDNRRDLCACGVRLDIAPRQNGDNER